MEAVGCMTLCFGELTDADDVLEAGGKVESTLSLEHAIKYQTVVDRCMWCIPIAAWCKSEICTDSFGVCVCCIPCTVTTIVWDVVVPIPYFCCFRSPTITDVVRARINQQLMTESEDPPGVLPAFAPIE
jgi:hypothetical protein